MATNRNSEHLRYRYGICLNDNCQKCKNKEVQQVAARKDFICEECGKPLRECPPPKSGPNKKVIAAITALVVIIAAGIGLFMGFSSGDTSDSTPIDSVNVENVPQSQPSDTVTVIKTDTIVKTDTLVVKEQMPVNTKATPVSTKQTATPKAEPSNSGNSTIRLSYGKYSGATKNGYPHGQGKLTYSTSRQINRNDMKGRTANAGDYVIGEFYNGFVVYGKHYDASGNLLESLTFGVGSEDSYDSK